VRVDGNPNDDNAVHFVPLTHLVLQRPIASATRTLPLPILALMLLTVFYTISNYLLPSYSCTAISVLVFENNSNRKCSTVTITVLCRNGALYFAAIIYLLAMDVCCSCVCFLSFRFVSFVL